MARGAVKLSILSSYDKKGTDQAEKALERFSKRYGQLNKENGTVTLDSTTAALARQSIAADQLSAKLANVSGKATAAGTAMTTGITLPLAAAGAAAFTVASNFESSMSRVSGALNDPTADMDQLRELAIDMGASTVFSASEAGAAMEELAKGGLKAADIQSGALATTMDLAAAGGLDLATAANTVVQAMGAFGIGANDSSVAANALAGAAAASSADVSDLTQGLSQASAQANSAGWSIMDTTATLAAFADAGIKGSDAGTSLKTMLQRLAAPTGAASAIMQQYGINVRDSNGNMLDAASVAGVLSEKLGGLSSAEKDAALQAIFGSDASRAALVMMNQGRAGIERYTAATNDQTAAQRLADSQMGDSARAIEEMKGALESAAIEVGGALAPMVTGVANAAAEAARAFAGLSDGQKQLAVGAAVAAAAIGPLLLGIGSIFGAAAKAVNGYARLTSALAKHTAAVAAGKAATTGFGGALSTVKTKLGGLLSGMTASKAGALGLAAVIGGTLVYAFASWLEHQRQVTAATKGLESAQLSATAALNGCSAAANAVGLSYSSMGSSVDAVIAKQAQMAESIKSTFTDAYAAQAQMDAYGATINELANKSGLSAAEQARLKVAVDGLNQACGTSYSVLDAQNGVLADQTGAAMGTTQAINDLIAAKKAEAMQSALQSAYSEELKQQQEALKAVAEATKAAETAKENYLKSNGNEALLQQYTDMNNKLAEAQAAYDSVSSSMSAAEEQMTLYQMGLDAGSQSLEACISGQQQFVATMAVSGGSVTQFVTDLQNAGVTSQQFSQISQQDLMAIATSYQGNFSNISWILAKYGIDCAAAGANGNTAMANAITSTAGNVANAAGGMAAGAAGSARTNANGTGAGSALTSTMSAGINATIGAATSAATSAGSQSAQALHDNSDGYGSGSYMGQGFVSGIGSWVGGAISAARELARSAINAVKQEGQEGSPWRTTIESGKWAAQGLAVGISANAGDAAKAAANMAAGATEAAQAQLSAAAPSMRMAMEAPAAPGFASNGGEEAAALLAKQYSVQLGILEELRWLRANLGAVIASNAPVSIVSERDAARFVQKAVKMNV